MCAKDPYGQPIKFAGARAVDHDGRLLWIGPMLPHQNGEFFLDGASIESMDLSSALELLKTVAAQGRRYATVTDEFDVYSLVLEGFTQWHGGANPVSNYAIVEHIARFGGVQHETLAGNLTWTHDGSGCDIIGYRVVLP